MKNFTALVWNTELHICAKKNTQHICSISLAWHIKKLLPLYLGIFSLWLCLVFTKSLMLAQNLLVSLYLCKGN